MNHATDHATRHADSDDARMRAELCRIGRSLFARGYVHGSTGNLSARLDDGGVLITATDACLGELEPDALVALDASGTALDPDARPSKTLALHLRIYAAEPTARAIVHTHSSHLVQLSLESPPDHARDDLLPPITPYLVMKVGHVPLLAYRRPGDPASADDVVRAIERGRLLGTPIRAVMLSRLGPNVWHDSPAAAMATLEELEQTAKLWLDADPKPERLSAVQLDELRSAFGARW